MSAKKLEREIERLREVVFDLGACDCTWDVPESCPPEGPETLEIVRRSSECPLHGAVLTTQQSAPDDCDDLCECGHERFAHMVKETEEGPCAECGCGGFSLGDGLKEAVENAHCVEQFLRGVLSWEESDEDGLAEAIEAAEKLTAALEDSDA